MIIQPIKRRKNKRIVRIEHNRPTFSFEEVVDTLQYLYKNWPLFAPKISARFVWAAVPLGLGDTFTTAAISSNTPQPYLVGWTNNVRLCLVVFHFLSSLLRKQKP